MSEHIHGSIEQKLINDFGEFINLNGTRLRKELITHYSHGEGTKPDGINGEKKLVYFLYVAMASGGPAYIDMTDKAEAEMFAQKLDWIFRKDTKNGETTLDKMALVSLDSVYPEETP